MMGKSSNCAFPYINSIMLSSHWNDGWVFLSRIYIQVTPWTMSMLWASFYCCLYIVSNNRPSVSDATRMGMGEYTIRIHRKGFVWPHQNQAQQSRFICSKEIKELSWCQLVIGGTRDCHNGKQLRLASVAVNLTLQHFSVGICIYE